MVCVLSPLWVFLLLSWTNGYDCLDSGKDSDGYLVGTGFFIVGPNHESQIESIHIDAVKSELIIKYRENVTFQFPPYFMIRFSGVALFSPRAEIVQQYPLTMSAYFDVPISGQYYVEILYLGANIDYRRGKDFHRSCIPSPRDSIVNKIYSVKLRAGGKMFPYWQWTGTAAAHYVSTRFQMWECWKFQAKSSTCLRELNCSWYSSYRYVNSKSTQWETLMSYEIKTKNIYNTTSTDSRKLYIAAPRSPQKRYPQPRTPQPKPKLPQPTSNRLRSPGPKSLAASSAPRTTHNICFVGASHSTNLHLHSNRIIASAQLHTHIASKHIDCRYPWDWSGVKLDVITNCDDVIFAAGQWAASHQIKPLPKGYEEFTEHMLPVVRDLAEIRRVKNIGTYLRTIDYIPMGYTKLTCPPTDFRMPALIDYYNIGLKNLSAEFGVPLIDTTSFLRPMWDIAADWSHPTEIGDVFAKLILMHLLRDSSKNNPSYL
jgi:hypothetical protein